jgi:hypothetical protein
MANPETLAISAAVVLWNSRAAKILPCLFENRCPPQIESPFLSASLSPSLTY